MYSQKAKQYLTQLMNGTLSLSQLEAINTDESREAISFSAKLFGDVTQETRTIYEAMKATFVTKMKRSPANLKRLKANGIGADAAIALMGKNVEVTIGWDWLNEAKPWLKIVTPLPNGWNGYHFPISAFLQNRDADQCLRIFQWIKDRQ